MTRTDGDWGNVTLREYDALNTIQRAPADILAAAQAYRREYLPALIVAADEPAPDADAAYFTPAGEAWVHDLHARYETAVNERDEAAQIDVARAWVDGVGYLAVSGILRHLNARSTQVDRPADPVRPDVRAAHVHRLYPGAYTGYCQCMLTPLITPAEHEQHLIDIS